MSDVLRELFLLWPAWSEIVGYVSSEGPRTADPAAVFGAACAVEHDRLAARLYGAGIGDSLEDAEAILDEVMDLAREGARPRFGRELGFDPEMFARPT